MIHIKNVRTLSGSTVDISLPFPYEEIVDGSNWTQLPALVDPHVHFRVPGQEYKEDWKTGSLASLKGGITTVLDMPNNVPSCCTVERLSEKKKVIDSQLRTLGMGIHYGLYLGADKHHLEEINKASGQAVAVKVFMGCSTGDLLIDTDEALDEVFKRARDTNLLVAVHAEDEHLLKQKKKEFPNAIDPAMHSQIRSREAAIVATTKAIELCAKYHTPLYLLHMSTKEEMGLVAEAKKNGLPVFAEVTTHHLFFTVKDYEKWKTLIQMNPPIRDQEDQEALWEALRNGVLDTIGTDHAPHTLAEKEQPFGKAPSGIPGVDTLLPLMLDAVSRKQLTLERLVELTSTNPRAIFKLPPCQDVVLVDLSLEKTVTLKEVTSKAGWSPYCGRVLKGWPMVTIMGQYLIKGSGFTR